MSNTSHIIHNTSEKPRFSVIIPLYNKAPYIKKALDSTISQTFNDWELIIVDDGSTDNSAALCEEFIKTASQTIHQTSHIIHQKNAGVAAARNHGVAESHGEYVCFLDADDWWEPTFLEEMNRLITEYPDAGLYATNFVYYKPGKTHVEHTNLKTGYINYPEVYASTGSMPVWTGAACMPRKVFDEVGGFPVGIKLGEDFLLWAKTALHYPVAFSEKPLAYYNNDVPASLRATRNLHAPEHHMLFHLAPLEDEIHHTSYIKHQTSVWKQLFDKLRMSGLLDYWMDERYHAAAAAELAKVDWSQQPHSAKTPYDQPIWLLRTKRCLMQIGSYCKQKLIHITHKT